MTIGEKIRYFRKRKRMTQGRLAELSSIHPVSIRKYETNAMVPKTEQSERIAKALGISSFALTGFNSMETVNDITEMLMLLYKSNIIIVDGERGKDGFLAPEKVSFRVHPAIINLFNRNEDNSYSFKSVGFLRDFLDWEKVYHCLDKAAEL